MSAEHRLPFWRRYIFSLDHKVIGVQYLLTAMFMALFGGGLAILMRWHLANPEAEIIKPETYLSIITIHGTIMIFFVVSLALSGGFGNFLIPLQIGARDMAYPFLNMLSYWTIVPACLLILGSFLVEGGAAASGWTAYPPLSVFEEAVPGSGLGQTLWILAMALFIASFTMGGLNYMTTILNCRTEGMTLWRMPILVWHYLVATVLGLLAFPALTAAALMLLFDRHLGTAFFVPDGLVLGTQVVETGGGTPILFQHLFWFLGHPEVYVLVLPAIGIGFEILSAFGRRPPFGYKVTVYALLILAFLSMIVWGHHMFVSGMNPWIGEYFSVATLLITIPFAAISVNLIATLWRSRIRLEVPMLFAIGMLTTLGLGGLGGLYLGTAASDIYFHDSYFVVGHFHLQIGVVTLLAIFGGTYFWYPKIFGRMTNDTLGRVHFWFTFLPMLAIFVMMHYQGLAGGIRRTYDTTYYGFAEAGFDLRMPITISAIIVSVAQLPFFANFFGSLIWGAKAPANPWNATTLEWTTPTPAPHGNWPGDLPVVDRGPYDYEPEEVEVDFHPQATVVSGSA